MLDPMLDLTKEKPNAFSYNYVEANYVNLSGGFNGIEFAGSFDFRKNLGVAASYLTASTGGFDYDLISVEGLYHFQFDRIDELKDLDVIAHVGIENGETSFNFLGTTLSVSDTGLRFGVKVRAQIAPQIEAFADMSYTTLFSGDLNILGGGVFSINEQIGVYASYELADANIISIGARFSF
ncbi:MAG: hypothetical protein JKX83_06590 [Pseudomonadales bacterium]|nr:hypothetical protein [Pseudomonadales bacterium]